MKAKIYKNENSNLLHWNNSKRLSYFEYRAKLTFEILKKDGWGVYTKQSALHKGYIRFKHGKEDKGLITVDYKYQSPVWFRIGNTKISFNELISTLDIEWNKEISDELTITMNDFFIDNHKDFNQSTIYFQDNSSYVEGEWWKVLQPPTFYYKKPKSKIIKIVETDDSDNVKQPMIPLMEFLFGERKTVDFRKGTHEPELFFRSEFDEKMKEWKKEVWEASQIDHSYWEPIHIEELTNPLMVRVEDLTYETCSLVQEETSPVFEAITKLGWYNPVWCVKEWPADRTPKTVITLEQHKIDTFETWAQVNRFLFNDIIVIKPNEVDLKSFKGCLIAFKWPNEKNLSKFKERIKLLIQEQVDFRILIYEKYYINKEGKVSSWTNIEVVIKFFSIIEEQGEYKEKTDYTSWFPNDENVKYKIQGLTGNKVSYYKRPRKDKDIIIVEGVFDGLVPIDDKDVIFCQTIINKNKLSLLENYFYNRGYQNLFYLPDNDDTQSQAINLIKDSWKVNLAASLLNEIKQNNKKDLYDLYNVWYNSDVKGVRKPKDINTNKGEQ